MSINPEEINILNIPELPEVTSIQDNDLLVIGQGIFARRSTVIALYNKYGIPGIITTLAGLQVQIDNLVNSSSVLYTAQLLNPSQQDQARDNINALSRTPNGNDQLIEGGVINPVYLSVDSIPGLRDIIVTQASLENAIVEYKNADGTTLYDVDWTEMIDDNYIRGNMTPQEKSNFRDKINALSKTPNGTDLLIGTNNKVNDVYLPDTIFGQLRWGYIQ